MKVPLRWYHQCEPARAADAAASLDGEGIVAAGVDHEDGDPGLSLAQTVEHGVERDRLRFEEFLIAGCGFWDVDGKEIVRAGDLDAMAREIEQRHVAWLDAIQEVLQFSIGFGAGDVHARVYVEAELRQRGGHGARIGGGLLQHRHAAICVVADDERDALIGKSGRDDHEAHQKGPETKHARAFTAQRDDAQATATGVKRG